jgi:acetyl-CoA acetyltransferase family protein
MPVRRAVIVDIVRSPFVKGRADGQFVGLHPVDLYAQVLQGLMSRTPVPGNLIEDVITGCVIQVGEQSGNIGRQAVLAAGLPPSVPAVTLDRKCGSAQQAVDFAAQGVIAGAYDVVIAGGVEMMSTVPMKANRLGRDNLGLMLLKAYPEGYVNQGVSAELIASKWKIDRESMDAFALASHVKAAAAQDHSLTTSSIIPIAVPNSDGPRIIRSDDGIRRDTTLEKLGGLKPAFRTEELARRFPEIMWNVTAGNSSQVTDGACAALIMEEAVAQRLGLSPKAAITHFSVSGDDPTLMLTAIIPATRKLLQRAGTALQDISAFEVNEAFASVVLAWLKEFPVDPHLVNQFGGAIALGHPVGASGGRLLINLLTALERSGGRYGIQTMCESGGMANATFVERL